MKQWNTGLTGLPMLMDRAYEGDETRQLVLDLGFEPVVPPKANRAASWQYDRSLYKRRNEVVDLEQSADAFEQGVLISSRA